MLTLGEILIDEERFEEAEKHLRLGFETRQTNSEPDWATYHTQSALGEALAGLGRDEEALKHLEESMTELQQDFDDLLESAQTDMLNKSVERLIKFSQSHPGLTDLEKWQQLKVQIQKRVPQKK